MSAIINLRRARKAKARSDAAAEADANRAKSGRTKAVRDLNAARKKLARARLDGHRLTRSETSDDEGA